MQEYVMGNGAIALGSLKAGVNLAAGYPGTPSSEIIETISKYSKDDVHVEWSVNEKAALEVAVAASYSGARALVTMKQMGLNVASDPLMSVAYVGVKGGLVIVSADDPGPISSQTEQDTRRYADFCRIPVFDPTSPEDAYTMIQDAFEYSEKYSTPVLFRPTTRICHAYASIDIPQEFKAKEYEGFIKDSKKWVIFPKLSFINHGRIEKRNTDISEEFSRYDANSVSGQDSDKAVISSGVSYAYMKECLKDSNLKLIKIATAFPFPEDFILKALKNVKEVLCYEELSPYIEEQILKTAGKHHLDISVHGKLDGSVQHNGENSVENAKSILCGFLECDAKNIPQENKDLPVLPVRPPVLCAGCPHRASFYAVKQAMKGKKAFYCGDIGCYTLGNAMPLDMVDTCLCMGAGITMAQGFYHTDKDTVCFSFTGDSTFFASGMTGVVNALYNEADIILCILDNSTTAMTGHQPHPGTGRNMMGNIVEKVDISSVLKGMGVKHITTINPFDFQKSIEVIKEYAQTKGIKAVIFKSPCIALSRPSGKCMINNSKCINCKKCIREIGCPAIVTVNEKVTISTDLCTGCTLCKNICPVSAIEGDSDE